jgi:hypothetical protein
MMGGWVYIMTKRPFGKLYVGVTNDVVRRVWQHKQGDGVTLHRALQTDPPCLHGVARGNFGRDQSGDEAQALAAIMEAEPDRAAKPAVGGLVPEVD